MHRLTLSLFVAVLCCAQEVPVIGGVAYQPLAAQVSRVQEALRMVGEPLNGVELSDALSMEEAALKPDVITGRMQRVLDRHCLAFVHINPEGRVSVVQGAAKLELVQQGWRTFLVKVHNEAGLTAALSLTSPNVGRAAGSPASLLERRWLDAQFYDKQPMQPRLSGLAVEYRILQLYARDAGQREAKLRFDAGQGTQDVGLRSELDVLFTIKPATKVGLRVKDENGKPTTASFLIRDAQGRVYPSQAKRLAPDFAFQPQVYRNDGDVLLLPQGDYTVECGRGPEYRRRTLKLRVGREPAEVACPLERWVDPAQLGWVSGDHHIHAAGCSHYERPTEGVYPQDMMRHLLGEDVKVGAVLTWGPAWYFQKTFFEGKENSLSTPTHRMRYDVEVSGFPSSHAGHLCLLGLREQDYPGAKRIEDWPSWGLPVLQWAKQQGAVVGYAHSGWGLLVNDRRLPTDEIPPFTGIGANEYIVTVTHDAVDFLSVVDTPWPWELNIWYHTLNVGFRTRIAGETDFPCIYDDRVGKGRSYVRQKGMPAYDDWVHGLREGRSYVSDGKSHLLNFTVGGLAVGEAGSELRLEGAGTVEVTAQVAAMLDPEPDKVLQTKPADQPPYWDLERARLGNSRRVPVELIVNGDAVARDEIVADGTTRTVRFRPRLERSSWVALRILPSSHTNPVFVTVAGQPIRASRRSAEWCLRSVDRCWTEKQGLIRPEELGAARAAYDHARQVYRTRLQEAGGQ